MNLLKIIVLCFIIYFIRRFIQMYRFMKAREVLEKQPKAPDTIDAEYKNLDN